MPLMRVLAIEPRACFRGSCCSSVTLQDKARIRAISLESQSTLLYKLGSKSAPSPFPPSLSSFFSLVPLGGCPRRTADCWAGMWLNRRPDPWNGSLWGDAETVDQTKPWRVPMTGASVPVTALLLPPHRADVHTEGTMTPHLSSCSALPATTCRPWHVEVEKAQVLDSGVVPTTLAMWLN